ncbi:hypothetical protein KKC1_11450 [Calderihabitans maritimus]|uniref:Uncharacterized protein n=1 Tax=Calderihabitans maritimus TaxID=1246530 RepID=A0A1Z5HRN8_9FIRM|nr:hypothetical protein KKC1_11450 [Calderihabitans maritimus]
MNPGFSSADGKDPKLGVIDHKLQALQTLFLRLSNLPVPQWTFKCTVTVLPELKAAGN